MRLARSPNPLRFIAAAAIAVLSSATASALVPPLAANALAARTVTIADDVQGKTIASGEGPLQVLFTDGTTITLGRNSALTIDRYAFDAAAGKSALRATLQNGSFRFIGGRAARTPGGVGLATPFGTVEVSSAAVDISLGQVPHVDMVFGTSVRLTNGGTVIATVRTPGYSIVPAAGGSAAVLKTRAEWRNALAAEFSQASGRVDHRAASDATVALVLSGLSRSRVPQTGRSLP